MALSPYPHPCLTSQWSGRPTAQALWQKQEKLEEKDKKFLEKHTCADQAGEPSSITDPLDRGDLGWRRSAPTRYTNIPEQPVCCSTAEARYQCCGQGHFDTPAEIALQRHREQQKLYEN